MLDDLAALRLQLDWGADEALGDEPVDRLAPPRALPNVRTALSTAPPSARPALPPATLPATVPAAAVADLPALHAALDGFAAHPLRATASTTVAPGGNPGATLVLIGEAPGADDDRSGQAYSGKAGATLDRVLGSAGLGRDTALLTFLVPWRPPGGRAPTETEVALALPFLHRLLALVQPRHLVLFGDAALRTLVDPTASLRPNRGRWMEATVPGLPSPVAALPMLPPDRWLQSAANRQATWSDLLTLQDDVSKP